MSNETEAGGRLTAPEGGAGRRRRRAPSPLTLAALTLGLAAVAFTYWRLFQGMDLLDESFYVAVPYRWAVGARPFVDETNILQIAGFFTYPFIKAFVALSGGASGILLFTRHLYFIFILGVSAAVFCVLRTLVRWQYALAVAAVYVTYVLFDLPQISYNSLGAGLLTLGTAFGLWAVLHGRHRWLAAAGVAHGLAAVAFFTLAAVVPVYAACLAFAIARRRRAIATYLGGVVSVWLAAAALILSFGWSNVHRSLSVSMHVAQVSGQAGGFAKLSSVLHGYGRFLWSRPYLALALVILYLILRVRPRVGRALLVLLPLPLWLAGQRALLEASGFAIVFGWLAPYLYLFLPEARRAAARKILVWGFVPSLVAGFVTGFTSADGYGHTAIGLLPSYMISGLFLIWALEAAVAAPERAGSAAVPATDAHSGWAQALVVVALAGILAVTIIFQFQFIPRNVPYGQLTTWMDHGPYWGIHTTVSRKAFLTAASADLKAVLRPGDKLMVMYQVPGLYLYWPGPVASNSVWISRADENGPLPQPTLDWLRRNRQVPDVIFREIITGAMPPAELARAYCGGFAYDVVVVRPHYMLLRRPAGATTAQILAGLEARASQAGRSQ